MATTIIIKSAIPLKTLLAMDPVWLPCGVGAGDEKDGVVVVDEAPPLVDVDVLLGFATLTFPFSINSLFP